MLEIFASRFLDYLFSFFKYFFKGIQIKYASTLPIKAVTNWTVENVVLPMASCLSFKAPPNIEKSTLIMRTAINTDLTTEPIIIPTGRLSLKCILLSKSQTKIARIQLPIIITGMIAGIAAIMGDAVIKNAVTGAITEIIIPLKSPTERTAMIIMVLTIGPVMYTDRFLKNWLAMQRASKSAV